MRFSVRKGPLGQCDRCSRVYLHKKLFKQLEYAGERLIWNGFLVCKRDLDVPNPQSNPFIPKNDITVVSNPRPSYYYKGTEFPVSQATVLDNLSRVDFGIKS